MWCKWQMECHCRPQEARNLSSHRPRKVRLLRSMACHCHLREARHLSSRRPRKVRLLRSMACHCRLEEARHLSSRRRGVRVLLWSNRKSEELIHPGRVYLFTFELRDDTLPGTAELLNVRNLAWILTTVLELVLLFYLVRQGLYRTHVAFFLYILAAIVQSAVVASSYRYWGPRSVQSWKIAWGSQGVVVCARWLAVMEITKRVLANYGGIWGMARRILILLSLSVLIYAIAFSGSQWNLMVLNGDRAVELCMATFIVSMFLFAR